MEARIQKWGNSLGLRIPAKLANQLCLKEGKVVDVRVEKDHLAIYPRKYQLEQMLDLINNNNTHNQEFIDNAYGKESW